MDVLVLESEPHAGDGAARALERAGHIVHRCHDPGASRAFPCAAVAGGPCPVFDRGVDVAVTVRAHPGSTPAPLEDGVSCALRAHVPVVAAGRTAIQPYECWAAEVVDGEDDLVATCERVAAAPLARHGEVATSELETALRSGHVDDSRCRAEVHRRRGRLKVTVDPGVVVDRTTAELAVRRVMSALREFDRTATGIDISLPGSDEPLV
jgi:hypothetical protein